MFSQLYAYKNMLIHCLSIAWTRTRDRSPRAAVHMERENSMMNNRHRFCALITLIFIISCSSAFARDDMYSSEQNWSFYLDSCKTLDNELDEVKKQMESGSDVVFISSIKFHLKRMANSLKAVDQKDIILQEKQMCDDKVKASKIIIAQGEEYEKKIANKEQQEIRGEHEKSPNYRKAKGLGLTDYEHISQIKVVIEKLGLEKAKKYLYIVGSNPFIYRISQKHGNYAVYSSDKHDSVTSGQILVLPLQGEIVEKGAALSGDYYRLLDVVEAAGLDGFKRKLPLFQRFISDNEKIGYGNPPDDMSCRKIIVGSWSYHKVSSGIDKFVFKANGALSGTTYSDDDHRGDNFVGTWSINNRVLEINMDYQNGRTTTITARIIKLTQDTLITHIGYEMLFHKKP